MQGVKTVGLDIAKSVFQVHGVDAGGQIVVRRKLKRRYVLTFFQKLPLCLVGGYIRASVVFSILDHEWPQRKGRLQARVENLAVV